MRFLFLHWCLFALLALPLACGDDSGPGTAPQVITPSVGTKVPTPEATPTLAPDATGRPSLRPRIQDSTTAVPTTVPTPTWTPSPGLTPEPTPPPTAGPATTPTISGEPEPPSTPTAEDREARHLLESAAQKMQGMGLAFEMDIQLRVQQDGSTDEFTIVHGSYAGDFHSGTWPGIPQFSSGELVLELPGGSRRWDVKSMYGTTYVWDEQKEIWEDLQLEHLSLPDPRSFLWDSDGQTARIFDTAVGGYEDLVQLWARSSDISLGGGTGDYRLRYLLVPERLFLREVTVVGKLDAALDDGGLFSRWVDGDITAIQVAARFDDYGKEVNIRTPELPSLLYEHQAFLLSDGRVLVPGGFSGIANNNVIVPTPVASAYIYDLRTSLWSTIDMPSAPGETPPVLAQQVQLSDNSVLSLVFSLTNVDVVSGENDPEAPEFKVFAHRFDSTSDSWGLVAEGGPALLLPVLSPLGDGKVLMAGGIDPKALEGRDPFSRMPDALLSSYILDPEIGEWKLVAPGPEPFHSRSHSSVLLQDGRVLLVGPVDAGYGDEPGRGHLYDPSTNTWSITGGMNYSRGWSELVLLADGRVLAAGAGEALTKWYEPDQPTSEIFDPATGEWTRTADMRRARGGHRLTLLPDGRVLASGGDDFWSGPASDLGMGTTEIFDPSSSRWSMGPGLEELRSGHTATLLADGRVLLAGGIALNPENKEVYPTFTTELTEP